MRLLFDMGHPAHVHCGDSVAATPTLVGGIFRNAIRELEGKGHAVGGAARDKDVTPLT